MKTLLFLLFVASPLLAQSDFAKKYNLMPNIGTKLFKSPLIAKAKAITPLILLNTEKLVWETVDSVRRGESVELIDLLDQKESIWVVRHKNKAGVITLDRNFFEFDINLYNKVMTKESVKLKKDNMEFSKRAKKEISSADVLLNKLKSEREKDKARYSEAIENEEIEIGMPTYAVIASWGEPDQKATLKRASGTYVIWYYTERTSSVTFYNNKVYEVATPN